MRLPSIHTQPAAKPTGNPVPVIEFEDLTYDVGETWEGEKTSHTFFPLKNTGDAVLLIKKVKTFLRLYRRRAFQQGDRTGKDRRD